VVSGGFRLTMLALAVRVLWAEKEEEAEESDARQI
jgi:hypothetical protein